MATLRSLMTTLRRLITWWFEQTKRVKGRGWRLFVFVSPVLFPCMMLWCVATSVMPEPTTAPAVVAARATQKAAAARATRTPQATFTPQPTSMPEVVTRLVEVIVTATPLIETTLESPPPSLQAETPIPTDTADATRLSPPATATESLPATSTPTVWPAGVPPNAQLARVLTVVDGDTIDVLINDTRDTVRYIGIDTPENNSQIGVQAAAANAALVAGQTVYLQPDTTDRDQYDRLLRYVYLSDSRMVNQEIVRQGHARSIAYPPDTSHQADFDSAQQEAQANQVGMWQMLAWAAKVANIRSGPGTEYPIVDAAQPGEALDIVGRTPASDWLKLGTGGWIFAQLVANPPANLPVVEAPIPPAPTLAPIVVPPRTNPQPSAPQPVAVCQCSGLDYDCADFGSWSSAQGCFEYCLRTAGYDVHRLDRDNDGIACEALR